MSEQAPEQVSEIFDPTEWEVVVSALRTRAITDPNGDPATIDDSVVAVRRR